MPETAEKRSYKRLTPEDTQRARKLLSEGISVKVVSENLGVGVATIYKLKNSNGNGNGSKKTTASNGDSPLVLRVRDTVEKLESKIQFHTAKAQEFQGQLDALKGTFSNLS